MVRGGSTSRSAAAQAGPAAGQPHAQAQRSSIGKGAGERKRRMPSASAPEDDRDAASDCGGGDDSQQQQQHAERDQVSVEDFKQFMCSRAYDIISEGRYRRFVVQGKASSEAWAIAMQESVSRVQAAVKRVTECIKKLDSSAAAAALGDSCLGAVIIPSLISAIYVPRYPSAVLTKPFVSCRYATRSSRASRRRPGSGRVSACAA
jgi:hypothetical protein